MPEAMQAARVLVIDDQEATRYILRRHLTRAGFKVEEAQTGAEGLAKALSLPDLIIADVNLPDMLGYEVCRRLRLNSSTVGIPVIQMSASFLSSESKAQALEGGADSYLTQPIDPAVLLAQVSALLRLRKAEALSNLSARQWQTTFDSLGEGLALIDVNGLLLRANRMFLEQLAFTPSEIENKNVAEVFESRFDLPFKEFVSRAEQGGSVELSTGTRWFRLTLQEIDAEIPGSAGSVLLMGDVTENKKLQETLKMSERLAATGRLAHIIAHEINNPLEAMSNLLYLALNDPGISALSHQYLEMASTELTRISQITKQVLAYHRNSKLPLLTSANELLESVLAIFRSQLLSHSVNLVADMRSTRSLTVHPGEIRQVFGNLLSNALDGMGSEGGRLVARCSDAFDMRTLVRGVRFTISDSGCGISPEAYPKIFDAFYTTKELKGSGVGLWLSAEVIRRHGGSLRVRTRVAGPYRGTLFSVFLPLEAST